MNIAINPDNTIKSRLKHDKSVQNTIPYVVANLDSDTSSFLKTEQSIHRESPLQKQIKKESIDINDQFDVIISKYSLIKNKLNNLWNKLD